MSLSLRIIRPDEVSMYSSTFEEVTNPKVMENKDIAKYGLFSQQIFGPLQSFHCACKKDSFKGRSMVGNRCPKCKVPIDSSLRRLKTAAYITLPFKVFNPLMFYIISLDSVSLKNTLLEMIYCKRSIVDDKTGKVLYDCNNYEDIKRYVLDYFSNKDSPIGKVLKKYEDMILIDKIIVIPPSLRPFQKIEKGIVMNELNEKYINILKLSSYIKNIASISDIEKYKELLMDSRRLLQRAVFVLYDYVFSILGKKTGLLRSNILGKRVDFSGRAVIVPEPSLKLNECGIPYVMALEILKPAIIPYLVSERMYDTYMAAMEAIEDSLNRNDYRFLEILQQYCDKHDQRCILNRQPTLHRVSVLAFKVKVMKGYTIRIHPMVCPPYNADFDGDQMAVYFPITETSFCDVNNFVAIESNLLIPSNFECTVKANQDIVLGLYCLTLTEEGKRKVLDVIPEKARKGIEFPLDSKRLSSLLHEMVYNLNPLEFIECIDILKRMAFEETTKKGFTLSLSDVCDEELIEYSKNFFVSGDVVGNINRLNKDEFLNKKLRSLPFAPFIESGSRGSWEQARQLVFARGYIADSVNRVKSLIVESFGGTGLSPYSFFLSSYGTRKGLLDTALSTGDSGYLTRQMIYATQHIEVDPDNQDCGTTDGVEIYIRDKKMAESLRGRYLMEMDGKKAGYYITSKMTDVLVGKRVKFRSPIYCVSEKICQTCYGRLRAILHSNQVGIIATQALGERSTQLVLRTFHTSGAILDVEDETTNKDIISGIYLLRKLLHSPEILLLEMKKDKEKSVVPEDILQMMYDIFSSYGNILMVHFEVVLSSMMWSPNDMFLQWRLDKGRDRRKVKYVSVLKVPSRVYWLSGAAFSDTRNELIKGVIRSEMGKEISISYVPSLCEMFEV